MSLARQEHGINYDRYLGIFQIKRAVRKTHLCVILLQPIYILQFFYTILLCVVFYTYRCICKSTEDLDVVLQCEECSKRCSLMTIFI